jgi:hypothetical protein
LPTHRRRRPFALDYIFCLFGEEEILLPLDGVKRKGV